MIPLIKAQEKQFQKSCKKNSVEAYDNFMKKYPVSEYTEEAEFNKAVLLNTPDAFEYFITKYPSGKHNDLAESTRCRLAYLRIENSENIDLYKNFLEGFGDCSYYNNLVRRELTMLEYRRTEKINTIEAFIDFRNRYPDSKYDLQVDYNIQKLKYEFALAENTLLAYNNFINKYPESNYSRDAVKKIETIEVESAINSNSIDSVNKYYEKFPDNAELIAFMKKIEGPDYFNAKKAKSVYAYEAFLLKYPDGFYKQDAEDAIEKIDYDKIKNSLSIKDYKAFLEKYPQGNFKNRAKHSIYDLNSWDEAKKEDWYSEYEDYIEKYPDGFYIKEATERLEWLKSQTAKYSADYKKTLKGGPSPYSNVSSPFFKWKVTFRENGGLLGYKIKGSGWYYDKDGEAWGNSSYSGTSTGELVVKPGGSDSFDTWFSGSKFVGGYIQFYFRGEDAGGHDIKIEVKIDCY